MNGDDSFEKVFGYRLGAAPQAQIRGPFKTNNYDHRFTRYRGVKIYSQQQKCHTFSEHDPRALLSLDVQLRSKNAYMC